MTSVPDVAILLCTRNGAQYLGEQLASVRAQTHARWTIRASDDGSTDTTRELLNAHGAAWGGDRLTVRAGPQKGFVANFLSLACDVSIGADYYSFCDQDDVWEPDKLECALTWLQTIPPDRPALYCGRTRLMDEAGIETGLSPLFAKPPAFRNALVQSIAGGNTMVFNQAARQLLVEAGPDVDVITHDWWLYMLVTGCGGAAHYDPEPHIRYRQHGENLVGSNASWPARYARARRLMAGNFSEMNQRNLVALLRVHHRMSPDGKVVLERFVKGREAWLAPRVLGIARSGVYHHTGLGTLGLVVATIFKKL